MRFLLLLALFAVSSEGLLWSIPKNIHEKSIIEAKEKYCWYLFGTYHKCLKIQVKHKVLKMMDEGTKIIEKKKLYKRPATKISRKYSKTRKNKAIQHVLRQ